MRNLFDFLVRYNYIFVFLILEVISFFFIIRNHNYQKTGFLNSANVITGGINETYFKFSEYLNLGKVNEKLKNENAQLRERLQKFDAECFPNEDICDTNGTIIYQYIPVKAITFSTNKINNFITFNKGSKAGIEKDMGVITNEGVIGIINKVSANYSTAMSLLHKDCQIKVKVKRLGCIGTVQWRGGNPNYAEITDITQSQPVMKGDSIITSGGSAIFPEGLPVGVISDVQKKPGSPFHTIIVHLSGQHETLQFAYVINNLYQKEQLELEKQNEKAE